MFDAYESHFTEVHIKANLALDKFTANRAQFKLNKTVPPLSARSIILMRSLFIRF